MNGAKAYNPVRKDDNISTKSLHWATVIIARTHRAGDIAERGEWLCMCRSCGLCRRALVAESQAEAAGGAR